jgi:hypothetical protein
MPHLRSRCWGRAWIGGDLGFCRGLGITSILGAPLLGFLKRVSNSTSVVCWIRSWVLVIIVVICFLQVHCCLQACIYIYVGIEATLLFEMLYSLPALGVSTALYRVSFFSLDDLFRWA